MTKVRDLESGPVSWPVGKKLEWTLGVRGQETIGADLGDLEPVITCTAAEDMARQEYGLQSQIGYQIQRFGVGHPVSYGSVDFDLMDLTTAKAVVAAAAEEWLRLPKVIRDRYQSWANVEAAIASGEFDQVMRAAGAVEVPSTDPSARASDSAPVQGEKPA